MPPGGIACLAGHEQVCATHARPAIAGEVKGLIVHADEWRSFVTGGVYIGAGIYRLLPQAILEARYPYIVATITAGAVAYKV